MASTNDLESPSADGGGTLALLNALAAASNNTNAGHGQSSSWAMAPGSTGQKAVLFIAPVLFGIILMILILGSVLHYRLKVRAKVAIICREFQKVDEALLKYRALKDSLNDREHEQQAIARADAESLKTAGSSTTSSNLDDDKQTQESTLSWDSDATRLNGTITSPVCEHTQKTAQARYQNQNRSYSMPLTRTEYTRATEMLFEQGVEEEECIEDSENTEYTITYAVPTRQNDAYSYKDKTEHADSVIYNNPKTEELQGETYKSSRRDSQLSLQRKRIERQQPLYVGHDSIDANDALSRRCQRFIRQDPILEPYSSSAMSTGTVFTITGSVQPNGSDVTKDAQQNLPTSPHISYLPSIPQIQSSDTLLP